MVSKASDDFPEPDKPVITTSRCRGMSTSMFLRLWTRAPRTAIQSWAMDLLPGFSQGFETFILTCGNCSANARGRPLDAATLTLDRGWRLDAGGCGGTRRRNTTRCPRPATPGTATWRLRG